MPTTTTSLIAPDADTCSELSELVRLRNLRYPILNKEDFLSQMLLGGPVVFKLTPYEPGYAASLMPTFLFPIKSEQELIAKAIELMISRGRLSLHSQPHDYAPR
jgi:hypothetical protein